MKIAISGKGGCGKSTIAAALALLLARKGKRVLALDADPDANLACALGLPSELQQRIVPISQQVALIEERTGAKVRQYGQVFRLNPDVSDIADNFATKHQGVALLVLGAISKGGSGCACPESVLIRALVSDLVLYKDDALIMDMEAGVEHLGRGTARGVNTMLVVVEPGQRSVDSTLRVLRMASDIGVKSIKIVANKVSSVEDEAFIRKSLPGNELIGVIPFSEDLRRCDREGISVLDGSSPDLIRRFEDLLASLEGLGN